MYDLHSQKYGLCSQTYDLRSWMYDLRSQRYGLRSRTYDLRRVRTHLHGCRNATPTLQRSRSGDELTSVKFRWIHEKKIIQGKKILILILDHIWNDFINGSLFYFKLFKKVQIKLGFYFTFCLLKLKEELKTAKFQSKCFYILFCFCLKQKNKKYIF